MHAKKGRQLKEENQNGATKLFVVVVVVDPSEANSGTVRYGKVGPKIKKQKL